MSLLYFFFLNAANRCPVMHSAVFQLNKTKLAVETRQTRTFEYPARPVCSLCLQQTHTEQSLLDPHINADRPVNTFMHKCTTRSLRVVLPRWTCQIPPLSPPNKHVISTVFVVATGARCVCLYVEDC